MPSHPNAAAVEAVHRLLFRALLEIRAEGHKHKNKLVFHLADLFRNVALDMEEAARGRRDYDQVLELLHTRARDKGLETWLVQHLGVPGHPAKPTPFAAVLDRVVQLARELHPAGQDVDRTDLVVRGGGGAAPPAGEAPARTRLREYLLGQPIDRVYMLAAVMYLGRGDFDSADELTARFRQMGDAFQKSEWAINQLLGKSPLADYLTRGRERLAELGVSPDKLLGS
jgi:hypothetical protein